MEEAKNIKIHLTRSASAVDLKLPHVPKNRTAGHDRNPPVFKSMGPQCSMSGIAMAGGKEAMDDGRI